ncbi:hypothetical protein [Romboutsia ilealis]|uniref:hypothetical protein n=1 Tax=Romboutsia ilealis TaxID=1115758 RepID=UPI0026F3EFED|nr:hypothetical protein [Romboutsia ilealis]
MRNYIGMTEKNRNVNIKADKLIIKLKSLDENTLEYQDVFTELYLLVKPHVMAYAMKRKQISAQGLKMDKDDIESIIVDASIFKAVKSFKVDKNTCFLNLAKYVAKQLFNNELDKYFRDNHKSLTTATSYDALLEQGFNGDSDDFDVSVLTKEGIETEYETFANEFEGETLLDEFISIYEKHGTIIKMMSMYKLSEQSEVIGEYLGVLNASNKDNVISKAKYNAKQRFMDFCIKRGYNIQ